MRTLLLTVCLLLTGLTVVPTASAYECTDNNDDEGPVGQAHDFVIQQCNELEEGIHYGFKTFINNTCQFVFGQDCI